MSIQIWWLLMMILVMAAGLAWQAYVIDGLRAKLYRQGSLIDDLLRSTTTRGYRPTAPPPERVEDMRIGARAGSAENVEPKA